MVQDVVRTLVSSQVASGVRVGELRTALSVAGWPDDLIESYTKNVVDEVDSDGTLMALDNVSKKFDNNDVLKNVSLRVQKGTVMGVIGVSGSGKTTLLHILSGFEMPSSGRVILYTNKRECDLQSLSRERRKCIGVSSQEPSFYEELSVQENLEYFSRIFNVRERDGSVVTFLINLVNLHGAKDVLAKNLSGGMRKRLDIACALVHNPEVLILDEPLADLDPLLRRQVIDLIRTVKSKGTTVVLSSHFLSELREVCDRIIVLKDKKIIDLGSVQELEHVYCKNFEVCVESVSREYASVIESVQLVSGLRPICKVSDCKLIISTSRPEEVMDVVRNLLKKNNDGLVSLEIRRPDINEVFEALV